jgi:VDE lipocalin domain
MMSIGHGFVLRPTSSRSSSSRAVELRQHSRTMLALQASTTEQPSTDKNPIKEKDVSSYDGGVRSNNVIGTIVFLLPSDDDGTSTKFGVHSPVTPPSFKVAAKHLAKKSFWFSEGQTQTNLVTVPATGTTNTEADRQLLDADILIALGLQSPSDLKYAAMIFEERASKPFDERFHKCHFALDCNGTGASEADSKPRMSLLPAMVGPYVDDGRIYPSGILPWTDVASAKRFYDQMLGLFDRWTSDDFTVALMLFLNRFSGSTVNWVSDSADATWEKGPVRNAKEFFGMATKCGDCLVNCLQDETCKKCLETLTELDTRDQAASYRTIVSYESEYLEKFSFCVFQKHNIFQCDAKIPTIPKVDPMARWRGGELTEETARSLLVGHLDDDVAPEGSLKTDISWKVACGANVAYDQFPSQNQLFYEAAKGRDMWYDPVFRVETLDGRNVWCKVRFCWYRYDGRWTWPFLGILFLTPLSLCCVVVYIATLPCPKRSATWYIPLVCT